MLAVIAALFVPLYLRILDARDVRERQRALDGVNLAVNAEVIKHLLGNASAVSEKFKGFSEADPIESWKTKISQYRNWEIDGINNFRQVLSVCSKNESDLWPVLAAVVQDCQTFNFWLGLCYKNIEQSDLAEALKKLSDAATTLTSRTNAAFQRIEETAPWLKI